MCLLAICLITTYSFLLDSIRLLRFFSRITLNPNTWLSYPLLCPVFYLFFFFFFSVAFASFYSLSWSMFDTILIFYLGLLLALYRLSAYKITHFDLSSFRLAQTVGGRSRGETGGQKTWKKKTFPFPTWSCCLLLWLIWSMSFKKDTRSSYLGNKRY